MTEGTRVAGGRCVALGLAAGRYPLGRVGATARRGAVPAGGSAAADPGRRAAREGRTVGRRDPFLPVPEAGGGARARRGASAGLAGLRVGEVEVVGIVVTTDARLAVLEASDGRTYVTRVNDRLA